MALGELRKQARINAITTVAEYARSFGEEGSDEEESGEESGEESEKSDSNKKKLKVEEVSFKYKIFIRKKM